MGKKTTEASSGKGSSKQKGNETAPSAVISYRLSDPLLIICKWTKLPPVQQPIRTLSTKPWACFKKRDAEKYLFYPKGQLAAKFTSNGTGKIFYINGSTAIELSQTVLGYQRVRLLSDKGPQGESKCLGWLDSFGNCVLCDPTGNVIANYNQSGGVIFNKDGFWKWRWDQLFQRHSKADSGFDLYSVSVKKSKTQRDSRLERSTSEKLLELHVKNAPSKRNLKLQEGKIYFQCKISDSISLWISSQDKIDLSFASNSFIIRLDVGISIQSSGVEEQTDGEKRRSLMASSKSQPSTAGNDPSMSPKLVKDPKNDGKT